MGRRSTTARTALGGWALVGVLAGCGAGGADPAGGTDPGSALDVPLDGFVAAAERPVPEALCDPDPTGAGPTPPALPALPGSPDAAFLESAPTTVEAYAWTVDDAGAARALVADAQPAAAACAWSVRVDRDLDGDGVPETPGTDAQQVAEWSADGWSGVRIVRTGTGSEQVDRRFVASGDVVLLVVTRADGDDPGLLTAADDYLTAVAERLR